MKVVSLHGYRGGNGKTCIATNLAYWTAVAGRRVLLVDADFKAPSIHDLVSEYLSPQERHLQLQTYLASMSGRRVWKPSMYPRDCLRRVVAGDAVFDAVLCGSSSASVDFGSLARINLTFQEAANVIMTNFRDLITELKPRYHCVLIDMSPGLASQSIVTLSLISDVVIEVIRDVALEHHQYSYATAPMLTDEIDYKWKRYGKKMHLYEVINELSPRSEYFAKTYGATERNVLSRIPFDLAVRQLERPDIISVTNSGCEFAGYTRKLAEKLMTEVWA